MARIRTIKPEYWSDEKLAREGHATRLVFIALWSMADDYGRLIDNEKQIEAFVFPHEEGSRDIRESLATLSRLGRIRRGTAENGQHVIEISNWSKHQKVDRPSERGAIPQIVVPQEVGESSRDTRETLARHSRQEVDLGGEVDLGPGTSPPPARKAFLAAVPKERRHKWTVLLNGWSEGLGTPNGRAFTPDQIDAGLSEYLAGTTTPDFSPQHVLRFVEKCATRKPLANGKADPVNGAASLAERAARVAGRMQSLATEDP